MSDPITPFPGHDRLIRGLERIAELSDAEREVLQALPLRVRSVAKGEEIVRENDRPDRCCLLLDGMLHRYKLLPEGTRSIVAFHIPGDIPDLQSLHLATMDHALGALVPSRVAFIPHAALLDVAREHPNIGAALWRSTLVDSAIHRQWVIGLGARPAYQRIAHLFCEMYVRMKAVGIAEPDGFMLPITQTDLGDATGLSTVHTNRSVQELRGAKLIRWERGFLRVLDWQGLRQAGGFDPTYLHLKRADESELRSQSRAGPHG